MPFPKRDLNVVFQGEVRDTTQFFGCWVAGLLETALRACAPPAEPLPAFQLRFADG